MVPRKVRWDRLLALKVPRVLVRAIQLLYQSPIRIKTDQGLTDWFTSTACVKQGCPLSPTLFALFMQPLQDMLHQAIGTLYPAQLLMRQLCCLLFADDVALLSTSKEGLQRHSLTFCSSSALTASWMVNLDKTAVLIFQKGHAQQDGCSGLLWQGHQITLAQQYKYLGMDLYSVKTIHEARVARLQQATKTA